MDNLDYLCDYSIFHERKSSQLNVTATNNTIISLFLASLLVLFLPRISFEGEHSFFVCGGRSISPVQLHFQQLFTSLAALNCMNKMLTCTVKGCPGNNA